MIMYGNDRRIFAFELYFSLAKGERAFRRAKLKDKDGFHVLEAEIGGVFRATSAEV